MEFFGFVLLFMGLSTLLSLYFYWKMRHIIIFGKNYPHLSIGAFIIMLLNKNTRKDLLRHLGNNFEFHKSYNIFTWLGLYGFLITSDPNLIEKVLLSQDMLNRAPQQKVLSNVLGDGLITLDVAPWQDHRRKMNPIFKHRNILNFFPIFHGGMKSLCAKFEALANDGCDYNIRGHVENVFLTVSLETTFGKNLEESNKEDAELLDKIKFALEIGVDQIVMSFLHLGWILTLASKYVNTKKAIIAFIESTLRDRLTMPAANTTENSNIFLNQVLKLYERKEFSFDDIANESKTILFAAFETSSNTMFACLCMLAMYPEVQEKLFEELKDVFPDKDVKIEHSDMDKMPYLDRVINETLRLYPPVPIVSRHAVKDTHLDDDLVFPKDLQLLFSLYHLHRRADIWGVNAHKFDPDNFLPENIRSRHPYSFIPFLKGTRNCIGWNYALYNLKIFVAGVIRNYRLVTKMKQDELQEYMVITLHFKNVPNFQIYRRD